MTATESNITSGSLPEAEMCNCFRRVVEFYCYAENLLLCKLCKFDLHLKCDTRPIYSLADDIFKSRDFRETIRELTSIKTAFLKFKSSDTLHTVRRNQEVVSAIGDTKRLRIRREKTNLEREMIAKIANFQEQLKSEQAYEKKDCDKMIRNIEYYLEQLERYREDGQTKKTFILLFKLKKIIPLILQILSSLYDRQRHHLVNSQIKGTIQRYMTSDNPGNVKLSRALYNPEHVSPRRVPRISQILRIPRDIKINTEVGEPVSSRSFQFRGNSPRIFDVTDKSTNRTRSSVTRYITTASFEEKALSGLPAQYLQMNTNHVTDKRISTMKVTNDGRILLLDYHNQMIDMYGLNKAFLFSLKLFRPIWDFDFTDDYEILVTCPYDGTLQHVQFSDEDVMFATSFMPTEKGCKAICCFPNRLFVSYTGDNPCIRFLSKDGVTYKTINSIMNDTLILLDPLFMHVSCDRRHIFVSDYTLQRITILNNHGDLIISHDVNPGCPLAIAVDREGNVLVSVVGTNEVRMISRDGQRSRILVGNDEIVSQPSAVAYKPESKLLLVSCDKDATVKMFHIV